MINNSSLKLAIVGSFKPTLEMDEYEKLATEIILYKYILTSQSQNTNSLNNINTMVSTYAPKYENAFLSLKNKYLNFRKIYFFLKKNEYNNLLSISEPNINIVYKLYLQQDKIVDFSLMTFDPLVYGIEQPTSKDYCYLKNIHENVICPIIQYYFELYNIKVSSMKIISSDDIKNNIGKKIVFYIDGIDSTTVYSDIINNNIIIDYSNISIDYPNIELINL